MNIEHERRNAILSAIKAIPEGRLSTYGAIAAAAGFPGNARLVGQILKHLPASSKLPWHRVINARGQISFPQGSESYQRQLDKLIDEGHPSELGLKHLNQKHYP